MGKKGISPSKMQGTSFVFTDFDLGKYELTEQVRGIAWGVETCPTSGKLHHQAYIQFFKQTRGSKVQKFVGSFGGNPKCHVEVMRGSISQNETYCSKEERYTKLGEFVEQGQRTDLESIRDDLKAGASLYDICETNPGDFIRYSSGIQKMKAIYDKKLAQKWRDVSVTALVGPAGSGKTRYASDKHGYENCFKVNTGGDFMFDGYDGEEVLIIDEMKGSLIKYTKLLTILDGHPFKVNVKGGHTWARWKKVYVCSNVSPGLWYNVTGKNLQRRFEECLQVSKGNTEPLLTPFDKMIYYDDYGN